MSDETITDGQLVVIRDLSRQLLGAPDVFGHFTHLVGFSAVRVLSKVEAASVIRQLRAALHDEGLVEALRTQPDLIVDCVKLETEPLPAASRKEPMVADRELTKPKTGEDPEKYAARVLNLRSLTLTCPRCKGNGTVAAGGARALRMAVCQVIFDVEPGAKGGAMSRVKFRLADPSLNLLNKVRKVTGADTLEEAAAVCSQLARLWS